MKTAHTITKHLREKLQAIRDKKMFPKGYALTVADKVGCARNKVYHTFSGNNADTDIIEELVLLAEKKMGVSGVIEVAAVDTTTLSEAELLKELERLKELHHLPRGYGERVAAKVGCPSTNVRSAVIGHYVKLEIVKGIIEVVQESKELELLERLNRLLNSAT